MSFLKTLGSIAGVIDKVAGIFGKRQAQAERETDMRRGAEQAGAASAKEGMEQADAVAGSLAETHTDEEIDAKALEIAERRAARRKRR